MLGFNQFTGLGNVTKDPELRYTPKGAALAQFGLALNEAWKDDAGEKHESCVFVDCTAWNKSAEVLAQYVRKGDPLLITGKLRLEQWEDKQGGGRRSKLSITVQGFRLLGGKRDSGSTEGDSEPQQGQDPTPARVTSRGERQAVTEPAEIPGDDDVPF